MKLATREDIDAPIEAVFRELSDFDSFERAILRRGAEVESDGRPLTIPVGRELLGRVVDLHGRVVGVNTAIASRNGGNMGIGFAIPIDMAKTVMQDLIRQMRDGSDSESIS